MGSHFKLVFFAENDAIAKEAAEAVFQHLEALNETMSDYLDGSEINRLSGLSGNGYWIKTSPELFAILDSASVLARETDGSFDVTIGAVTQVWRRAARLNRFPEPREIREARRRKGHEGLLVDRDARYVRLKKAGMRLDLGGIGKGYAADEGLRILKEFGIRSAMVDAGGDLAVSEAPPGRPGWRIAVSQSAESESDSVLTLSNCGIATSGDRFRFIEHKGKRYSHIVDPSTGVGLTKEVRTTVLASSATRADALATAVSVINKKKLKNMLRKFPGTSVWVSERKRATDTFKNWVIVK